MMPGVPIRHADKPHDVALLPVKRGNTSRLDFTIVRMSTNNQNAEGG